MHVVSYELLLSCSAFQVVFMSLVYYREINVTLRRFMSAVVV
jgi:hypothetical protein